MGTKEAFPRSAFKAMVEIIAGRLRKQEGDKEIPISEKMVQLLFDGMEGKIVLSQGQYGPTYANPAIFLKAANLVTVAIDCRANPAKASPPAGASGERPRPK